MSEERKAPVSASEALDAELEARAEALMKLYDDDMLHNPRMITVRPGSLTPGQKVEFDIVQGPHGPRAVAIRPVTPS